MSTTNEKVYVNSIWFEELTFNNGNTILKASIVVDDLIKFLKENKNKDGRVNLVISKKQKVEKGKSTHYSYLDTWEPSNSKPSYKTNQRPISKTVKAVDVDEEEENPLN